VTTVLNLLNITYIIIVQDVRFWYGMYGVHPI